MQRRPSATGVILVAGQKLSLGRSHAHTVVTVHVAEHTLTVEFPDGAQRTFSRTSTQPIRRFKAHRPHTTTQSAAGTRHTRSPPFEWRSIRAGAEGYGVSRKSVDAWLHRDVEQPVGVARIGGGGSPDRTFAKVAVLEGRHGI